MAPVALCQLLMLTEGHGSYAQAIGRVIGSKQSLLGNAQDKRDKREKHRVQEHSPAQIPNPCIPANQKVIR